MRQPFATDDCFCEADIQFVVAMKMGKRSTSIAQGGKSVCATGHWPIFHPELLQPVDQMRAQSGHETCMLFELPLIARNAVYDRAQDLDVLDLVRVDRVQVLG